MRVGPQRLGRAELAVTAEAHSVSRRCGQLGKVGTLVLRVRIVARGAAHRSRACAEEKVAPFARVDVAPSGHRISLAAFPGEGIAREEDLVTARAGVVDRLGTRGAT